MKELFTEILIKPLFNLLVFMYDKVTFSDLGIAIILLTVLIRLILYPLAQKAIRSQKEMMHVQPEIKSIQEKYKDNKEEQMKQIMAVYKAKKINPASGCLPLLLQMPILIALYSVFSKGFTDASMDSLLYSFIPHPEYINHMFLGLIDISKSNIWLALIAAAAQFYQSKMIMDQQKEANKNKPKNSTSDVSAMVTKQMTYVMPVVIFMMARSLNSGLALYWATTALFSIAQQLYVFKQKEK